MKNNMEKRACERWDHTALIAFSYFNQEPSFDTQTLNHCLDTGSKKVLDVLRWVSKIKMLQRLSLKLLQRSV